MATDLIHILAAEIPLLLLLMPKNKIGCLIVTCIFLVSDVFLLRRGKKSERKLSIETIGVEILISLILGLFFYLRWGNSARFNSYAAAVNMSRKQFCALITALLCCWASYGLDHIYGRLPRPDNPKLFRSAKKIEAGPILFIFLTALVTITLASTCSPFYPINDWVDPNTMFTVGKGMLKGYVPYRDLYEQKGPLLHAIHALGAMISPDNFLGVWLIEIFACFIFLWLLYQILGTKMPQSALVTIPLLAFLTYIQRAFVKGDSAEEFCLPLITFAILAGIKALQQNKFPCSRDCFLIGITSGCVLWIKYSMLGFYIGWFLFVVICFSSKKFLSDLIRILFYIFCGTAVISIPILLYFMLHNSLRDLFEGYFLNNILYYPAVGTAEGPYRILINLWKGTMRFKEANPVAPVLFAAGLIWCFTHNEKKTGLLTSIMAVSGFIFIFFSGTSFPYYTLIFGCFNIWSMMWLLSLKGIFQQLRTRIMAAFFFINILGILFFSTNMYMLSFDNSDYPQHKVNEIIQKSGTNQPTLLHYGLLDAGFNLSANLIPGLRFFCTFPFDVPEMHDEQDRYIQEAIPDFVITCHMPLHDTEHYELAGTFPGDFTADGGSSLFFLYQKKPEQDL